MASKPLAHHRAVGDTDKLDLSLRSLRVFVAVEEAGSMAVAAERIGASKSTVSQQISNLEQALGTRLIDRSARPISLTPAGIVLRRHAQRILEAVSEARAEMMELDLAAMTELRIGIIDDLDATITPDLVDHLMEQFPGCVVSASSGYSDHLTAMLIGREADVVVTSEPPQDPAVFDIYPLLREPFIMIAATGVIDRQAEIRPQLESLPFIRYSTKIPMGRLIEQHLRRLRFQPSQRYSFQASRSVFAMVIKSRGWAITTPLSVLDSERFRSDIDLLPLPFTGISRSIYLAARRAELGLLPVKLAAISRSLLGARLMSSVLDMAPWVDGEFMVPKEEAFSVK